MKNADSLRGIAATIFSSARIPFRRYPPRKRRKYENRDGRRERSPTGIRSYLFKGKPFLGFAIAATSTYISRFNLLPVHRFELHLYCIIIQLSNGPPLPPSLGDQLSLARRSFGYLSPIINRDGSSLIHFVGTFVRV